VRSKGLGTRPIGLKQTNLPLLSVSCSTEEDKVFENALAQFWEHSDRCGERAVPATGRCRRCLPA
jgi:hypothetical protein